MRSRMTSSQRNGDAERASGEEYPDSKDPFIIESKGPVERLTQWRKATFTVNAARRFRYTLDINNFEEQQRLKNDPAAHFMAGTRVNLAVERFKQAGRGAGEDDPPEGFGVGPKKLVHLLQDRKISDLKKLGTEGLEGKVLTNLEEGMKDSPEEIHKRKVAYGPNTYPKKKPNCILHFVWEAAQDTILIILMVAAVVSLGAEMWSEGVEARWYNGTAILVAVAIVVITTAGKDYKQSLQFRNLNDERENINLPDPCRPAVREAVERCQKAGVKVRMVTGDNKFTAKATAQECGILHEDGLVVEGPDFRTWDEDRLLRDLEKLVVMARSSPTDKLELVKALKLRGNVVAVTGEGTNDATALHEADIGLSMGIAGTEVAKESSDISNLDDNFTSVVKVVGWERSVYPNIQKFIQFQLIVNVTALTINFVAACSTGEFPLTAVQLLWVSLIMDTFGALALATEPPTDELMDRNPVGRIGFISRFQLFLGIVSSKRLFGFDEAAKTVEQIDRRIGNPGPGDTCTAEAMKQIGSAMYRTMRNVLKKVRSMQSRGLNIVSNGLFKSASKLAVGMFVIVSAPAVGAVRAIAPEVAEPGSMQAGDFEKSSNFAFGVVACVGTLFAIIAFLKSVNWRRRHSVAAASAASAPADAISKGAVNVGQTLRVMRLWHKTEYIYREELVARR